MSENKYLWILTDIVSFAGYKDIMSFDNYLCLIANKYNVNVEDIKNIIEEVRNNKIR